MKPSQIELACIRIANEHELAALVASRRAPYEESKYNIIKELRTPRESGRGRGPIIDWMVYLFLLPFRLLWLVALPVVAWIDRRFSEKKWLARHAEHLRLEFENGQVSSTKTVFALWHCCGCYNRTVIKKDKRNECLLRWIDVLYGEGVSTRIKLEEKADSAWRRHVAAVNEEFRGRHRPDHVHFADGLDLVIEELSRELPPYQ